MGIRHIKALEQLGATVVAVCDLRAETLERFSSTARIYQNWQELIDKERGRLDLVCVVTNGPSHAPIVINAARAGIKHILCEKPMATSGRATREMVRVCEEEGAFLAVNLSRRFTDRYLRLRDVIQSGVIGEVRHVTVIGGAGGLGCIASIYFDLIEWLTGAKAVWVIGEVEQHPLPNVRGHQFFDPGGRGMIRYNTTMNASVEFSEDIPKLGFMHLRGTQGHMDVGVVDAASEPNEERVRIWTRPEDKRDELKTRFVAPVPVQRDIPGLGDVVDATRRCMENLLNGRKERTDLAGISSVDTVLAFHLSGMRGNGKVQLPLHDGDLSFDVPIT